MNEVTRSRPTAVDGRKDTPNDDGPTLDEVHETLSEARRRYILRALWEFGPTEKKQLAKYVAAIKNGKHPDELAEQEHKRTIVSLHQAHLPYLSKLGIVAWDKDTNTVALGPYADCVLRYVDEVEVEDEQTPRSFTDRAASTVSSLF